MSTRSIFSFTYLQKKGIIILLALLFALYAIRWLVHEYPLTKNPLPLFPGLQSQANPELLIPNLDINTAVPEVWSKLPGIGPVLSKRIVKYREAIGGFSKLEDLKKVYGISDTVFNNISPYLSLDSSLISSNDYAEPVYPSTPYSLKVNIDSLLINSADISQWQQLPGIGNVLSQRIVKYRASIRGFDAIEDLQKVYGISEETFLTVRPFLFLDSFVVHTDTQFQRSFARNNNQFQRDQDSNQYELHTFKEEIPASSITELQVDINLADSSRLADIPGISPSLAGRIIKYRTIIGHFAKKEYLNEVYGMTSSRYTLIKSNIIVGDISSFPKLDLNMIPEWKLKYYPFLTDEKVQQFIDFKAKIRRIDNWEELEKIPGWDKEVLTEMKLYFSL